MELYITPEGEESVYLCSHGLEKGKSGYRYFSYGLVKM